MFTKENAAEHGRKGGRTTVQRHGRQHMSKIGRKGFKTTTERHFQGNRKLHLAWLVESSAYQYFAVLGQNYGNKFGDMERPTHPAHTDHTWF